MGDLMYVYTKDDTVTPIVDHVSPNKVLDVTYATTGGGYHFINFSIDLWEVE